MNNVAILSELQKEALASQKITDCSMFNPVLDYYDRWVISEQEIQACTNPEFQWVRLLALTEFEPKEISWPDRP
jgi:hypothetical protein